MNILEKMNSIKLELQQTVLKKSGKNKFAGFDYFELKDFLPKIVELCEKHKLHTMPTFTATDATLIITNCEKLDEVIEINSPMGSANLKGCHEVQNIGAVETYQKRYLYMSAFDIIESDALEPTVGDKKNDPQIEKLKEDLRKIATNNKEIIGAEAYDYAMKAANELTEAKKLNNTIIRLEKHIDAAKDHRNDQADKDQAEALF